MCFIGTVEQAEEAGIQVMVAVHRRNQLAQMVSAFKIQNKADHIQPGMHAASACHC